MGFGILFIGYFLTLNIPLKGVNLPPDFIGYILMIFACRKLNDYSRYFKKTANVLVVISAMALILTGSEICTAFNVSLPFNFYDGLTIAKCFVSMLMHYYLLLALREISGNVGRNKIARKCARNMYIILFALLLQAVFTYPAFRNESGETYIIFTYVIANAALLLISIQIFSCYMWICYEGDEDMDPDNGFDPLAKMVNKSRKEVLEYKKNKKAQQREKKSGKK